MRRLIRGTWLPTVALMTTVVLTGVATGSFSGVGGILVTLLFVTPPLWWWIVLHRGTVEKLRGALAGALGLAVAFGIPIVPRLMGAAGHGTSEEMGALATAAGFAVLGGMWLLTIPIGVILGAFVAAAQERWVLAR